MAGGWSRDGAVQDQIDASVGDAVKLARSRLPAGESLTHCEECEAAIPEARRKAVREARPHAGHQALVELESLVDEVTIVTQNVDGLHQVAGNRHVVELHGTAREVACMDCGVRYAVEPLVAAEAVAAVPAGSAMLLGSSQPIRDVHLAAAPRTDDSGQPASSNPSNAGRRPASSRSTGRSSPITPQAMWPFSMNAKPPNIFFSVTGKSPRTVRIRCANASL